MFPGPLLPVMVIKVLPFKSYLISMRWKSFLAFPGGLVPLLVSQLLQSTEQSESSPMCWPKVKLPIGGGLMKHLGGWLPTVWGIMTDNFLEE